MYGLIWNTGKESRFNLILFCMIARRVLLNIRFCSLKTVIVKLLV